MGLGGGAEEGGAALLVVPRVGDAALEPVDEVVTLVDRFGRVPDRRERDDLDRRRRVEAGELGLHPAQIGLAAGVVVGGQDDELAGQRGPVGLLRASRAVGRGGGGKPEPPDGVAGPFSLDDEDDRRGGELGQVIERQRARRVAQPVAAVGRADGAVLLLELAGPRVEVVEPADAEGLGAVGRLVDPPGRRLAPFLDQMPDGRLRRAVDRRCRCRGRCR